MSLELSSRPARYFYNRFWMLKLRRWGWSYVEAGMFARKIAEDCYLSPHMHAQILRGATETYRFPDRDKGRSIIREIMARPKLREIMSKE